MIHVASHHFIPYPAYRVPPVCPYCGRRSELIDSIAVYHQSFGPVWCCIRCEALVGCHKNSKDFAPLGRLANPSLRRLKMQAHELLDPWWRDTPGGQGRAQRRKAVYLLLAQELDIHPSQCHVAEMDDTMCERAIAIMASSRWRVLAAGITHSANEA